MSYSQLYAISPTCQPINAVIGDESIFAFWENVAPDELSEKTRIQTHLAYVEQQLRQKDVSQLSISQQQNRKKALDLLHNYWTTQSFSTNYDYPQKRRPCFVDRDNNICAVGYLIQQTAGQGLVERINERYQYAKIMDMQLPELNQWMDNYGLTALECAMIQPNYVHSPKYGNGRYDELQKFLTSKLRYPKYYGESKEVEFLLVISDQGKVTHTEVATKKVEAKLSVPVKKILKSLTFEPAKAFGVCGDGARTVVQYLKVIFNNKYSPMIINENGYLYDVNDYCGDTDYEDVNVKEPTITIFGWLKNILPVTNTTRTDFLKNGKFWQEVSVFVDTKKGRVYGKVDNKGRFELRLKRSDILNNDTYFDLNVRHFKKQIVLRDVPFNHQKLEIDLKEHPEEITDMGSNCQVPKYLSLPIVIQQK